MRQGGSKSGVKLMNFETDRTMTTTTTNDDSFEGNRDNGALSLGCIIRDTSSGDGGRYTSMRCNNIRSSARPRCCECVRIVEYRAKLENRIVFASSRLWRRVATNFFKKNVISPPAHVAVLVFSELMAR